MVMGELPREVDLVVLGGGPGGYAAAFRAADLGLETVLVDAARRARRRMPARRLHPLQGAPRDRRADPRRGRGGGRGRRVRPARRRRREAPRVDPAVDRPPGPGARRRSPRPAASTWWRGTGASRRDGSIRVARDDAPPATLRFKHAIVATGSRPATLPGLEAGPARVGLDRGAGAARRPARGSWSWAAATSGSSSAASTPRSGAEVTVVELPRRAPARGRPRPGGAARPPARRSGSSRSCSGPSSPACARRGAR